MTVDAGGRKQKSSAGKFTKEELADCFTLKECLCDTKTKLGQKWPDYNGVQCLQSDDKPLRAVAATIPETLGFVHIVNEEETVAADETVDDPEPIKEDEYHSDSESENEF